MTVQIIMFRAGLLFSMALAFSSARGPAQPTSQPNLRRCLTFDYLKNGQKMPADFEAGRWKRNKWHVSSESTKEILVSDRIAAPNSLGLVTDPTLTFSPLNPETKFFAVEMWYGTPSPKRGDAIAYDQSNSVAITKLNATPHMSLLYSELNLPQTLDRITSIKISGNNIIVAKICFLGKFR